MKTWKIVALVVTLSVVVASLLAASVYAMTAGQGFLGMHGTNLADSYGNYYGNMMSGLGAGPTTSNGMMGGRGMMGGYAYNQQGTGCGNQNQATNNPETTSNPITISQATTYAQNYVTGLNNPDLTVKQVEEYSNNFYVLVTEKSTGNGALELVVNKYTGAVLPEMGPNMMWNTKYASLTTNGMMRGMMGAGGMMSGYNNVETPTTDMPVTAAQASTNAQQYLTANYPGTATGDVTIFYGYYTIEILSNGNPAGMISVNGYSGQVWYHNWHGTFIQETD